MERGFVKFKTFCSSKDIVNRMKRKSWIGRYLQYIQLKKELYSDCIKKLYESIREKNLNSKWAKGLRHFTKEYIEIIIII